jgi:hypothetical protein
VATFTAGKNAKLYLVDSGASERDLSSAITQVSLPLSSDTADTSALGDAAKTYLATLKDATVSIDGHRDATIEGYLFGVLGATTTFSYFPEGSASGKVKYSGTVIINSVGPASDVGDANKFSAGGQCSGTITRAVV